MPLIITCLFDNRLQTAQKSLTSIRMSDVWNPPKKALCYIYLQIDGEYTDAGNITTRRYPLDKEGKEKLFARLAGLARTPSR